MELLNPKCNICHRFHYFSLTGAAKATLTSRLANNTNLNIFFFFFSLSICKLWMGYSRALHAASRLCTMACWQPGGVAFITHLSSHTHTRTYTYLRAAKVAATPAQKARLFGLLDLAFRLWDKLLLLLLLSLSLVHLRCDLGLSVFQICTFCNTHTATAICRVVQQELLQQLSED